MKIFIIYIAFSLSLVVVLLFLRSDLDDTPQKVGSPEELSVFYWIWAGQKEIEPNVKALFRLCERSYFCDHQDPHLHLISYDNQQLLSKHFNRDILRNLNLSNNELILTFRLESLPSPYEVGDIYYKSKF